MEMGKSVASLRIRMESTPQLARMVEGSCSSMTASRKWCGRLFGQQGISRTKSKWSLSGVCGSKVSARDEVNRVKASKVMW